MTERQWSPDRKWWWDGQQWQPTQSLWPRPDLTQRPDLPLQQRVNALVARGYRVVSQTETTAQLVKPKTFSLVWFLVWTFGSFGMLFWVYPIYYLGKRESQVYMQDSRS